MARQNLILGLQAISAIGIFALGLLTYFGQSSRDLRLEMRQGFESIRVEIREENGAFRREMREENGAFRREMREEFAAFRKELRNINTRLARVEGHLGIPPGKFPTP